jgi:hypothetical protein
MAELLKEMPKRRGRGQVHPWDEWADGRVWKVKQGEDFQSAVESFRTQLYGKARALGKKLDIFVEADSVTFQFLEQDG